MYQENIIDMLMQKIIRFNQNDPQRIHHLIKVHSFAQMMRFNVVWAEAEICLRISCTTLLPTLWFRQRLWDAEFR